MKKEPGLEGADMEVDSEAVLNTPSDADALLEIHAEERARVDNDNQT